MAEQVATLAAAEKVSLGRQLPWYVDVWVRLWKEKPLGTFGGILILLVMLAALLAPVVTQYDPIVNDIPQKLKPPDAHHWLGTDNFGRDMFSRIVWGARISLYIGFGAVALGTTCAVIIGIVTGYYGGLLDSIVQRFVDAIMAFPWLIIMLTIMAVLGPGMNNVIIALSVGMLAGNSRIIRGATMSVKANLYVEAARCIGAGDLRILLHYMLPNVMAPIIIVATLGLGGAIMAEASLSFLGYGVPPPAPSWGGMLSGSGRRYMLVAPWMAVFPGIALSMAIFGFNMLGDALRDLLDPRLRSNG